MPDIHVWRASIPLENGKRWILQCDICSRHDYFKTWRGAQIAAGGCVAIHKANQCHHCGRTS